MNFLKKVGNGIAYPFKRIKDDIVDTWKGFTKEQIKPKTVLLVIVNIIAFLISNIIAARSFELGFLDNGLRFALPIAVVIYPLAVALSNVLADTDWVWTRRSAHLSFVLNLFMVAMFEIAIAATGGRETGDFAILSNTWYLLIASMISFYFGDLITDLVFKKFKEKEGTSNGKLAKRCIVGTLCGQLVDATIFITLGMHVLPLLCGDASLLSSFTNGYIITSFADPIGWANLGIMVGLQVAVKVLYQFILLPLIIWICKPNKKEKEEKVVE